MIRILAAVLTLAIVTATPAHADTCQLQQCGAPGSAQPPSGPQPGRPGASTPDDQSLGAKGSAPAPRGPQPGRPGIAGGNSPQLGAKGSHAS